MYASRISFRIGVEAEKCLFSCERRCLEGVEGRGFAIRCVGLNLEVIMMRGGCALYWKLYDGGTGEERRRTSSIASLRHVKSEESGICGEASEVFPASAELPFDVLIR